MFFSGQTTGTFHIHVVGVVEVVGVGVVGVVDMEFTVTLCIKSHCSFVVQFIPTNLIRYSQFLSALNVYFSVFIPTVANVLYHSFS